MKNEIRKIIKLFIVTGIIIVFLCIFKVLYGLHNFILVYSRVQ